MRRKIVAGNWKMNMTPNETVRLIDDVKPLIKDAVAEVVFCVPAIDIVPAVETSKDSNIKIGAENMYYEEKGAFTGELSPSMLVDAGVTYVIIGHSERRQYFNEDNDMINKKVRKAIEHELIPIICCGESISQREEGITLDFIKEQIESAFEFVTKEQAVKCVIAYEPIWAIGTGRVATSEQAQEVCEAIRHNIRNIYDDEVADNIRILYGGSVNAANAKEIFAQPDIDGGLVGGASLKPEFADIVMFDK
ncbi:MAG: triose-phosphate isomerase [Lachnospira sp.]|nr:triose-phosphate isomerase [Lachnospira sp.]